MRPPKRAPGSARLFAGNILPHQRIARIAKNCQRSLKLICSTQTAWTAGFQFGFFGNSQILAIDRHFMLWKASRLCLTPTFVFVYKFSVWRWEERCDSATAAQL
jgi:hypothetical protein